MINLADEYTDWDGLDRWLEAERLLGATFARQVMAAAKPGDGRRTLIVRVPALLGH